QRLSYSYKKTGEHIKAMEILNEAVRRDILHNRTFALEYRAWSLLFFYRDYEGTVKDVDLINKMQPKNDYTVCHGEPCNLLKGQALYKMGKYKKAIQVFKDLQEVERGKGWNPMDSFQCNFYMARCYSELKNYEKTIEIYNAQLVANDKLTEVHYQLGRIYNILGNKEKARKHLDTALTLLSEGYKMGEPYYEAFDEVFLYQIQDEMMVTTEK
ncbi:MAG TPA: tetratricopeptide repeat protein, partial [Flavobacteriaceae bacterium]|nr:tetratricopeptide repeat protein [Flavobacteriaceae bacterium]